MKIDKALRLVRSQFDDPLGSDFNPGGVFSPNDFYFDPAHFHPELPAVPV